MGKYRRALHGGFRMTEEQDKRQFFKDLGATAEQTVEEVRGAEENYFVLMQRMFAAFPGIADLNNKLQNYAEQNFANALEFSHALSQAKDLQDFTRINVEFGQKLIKLVGAQTMDFAEACTGSAAKAIKAAYTS
jgi:hypothetical protein